MMANMSIYPAPERIWASSNNKNADRIYLSAAGDLVDTFGTLNTMTSLTILHA